MIDISVLNPSTLEINWKSIQHNLNYFNSKLKPSTKRMFMIKASAYGNDAIEMAKRFEQDRLCEYFGVAYPMEGIELRMNGIKLPILVLNPSQDSWNALLKYSLEPEIHNIQSLNSFIAFIKSNASKSVEAYPIHLKFNTGMNRLGFDQKEVDQISKILSESSEVQVRSVMTHLSSAALEDEDKFTMTQLRIFDQICEKLSPILPKDVLIHALNSHGLERFPKHQYNMIRLGIGLYGASSIPSLRENLIPICKLTTSISAVRKVNKGDSISYSRSGIAPKEGFVATLAIGYADGFNRNLGNGNWQVEINGQLYPTIGNICMDLSMIFTGDDPVNIGDEVIIFGGKKDIHEFAEAQNTISYEAMTNLGKRVNRLLID